MYPWAREHVSTTRSTVRLAERLSGRPLAIHPGRVESVIAACAAVVVEFDGEVDDEDPVEVEERDGIAVVHVHGPIFATGDWITRLLGWPDYEGIGEVVDALREASGVRGVIFAFDSPGGDVQGMAEAAAKIEALAGEKPVYAVAGHNAFSAAYALAAPAEQIYVSEAGGLGSIGVVGVHVDFSGRDRDEGVEVTFLTYGERKVDGNPHEPLGGRAREHFQAEIDTLGEAFVAHVARHRGLSTEAVRGQEAGTFMGRAGLEAGLGDRVGTLEDARRDLRAQLDEDEDQGEDEGRDPLAAAAARRRAAGNQFVRSA